MACLPRLLIADDLSSGVLVRLLPSLSFRAGVLHAVFPSRRGMVPAVRALLDSLSEGFAANPLPRRRSTVCELGRPTRGEGAASSMDIEADIHRLL